MQGSSDYLGLNYYTRWLVTLTGKDPRSPKPGAPVNDLGWEVLPEGLERALLECERFGLPIVVTENGIADESDRLRPEFLRRSFAALDRARARGVDVRGYFHWSLYDNFEWADGHEGRFGLYAVDFDNPEGPRVKRNSSGVFRDEVESRISTGHS
jgi:beta-glucosidase